MLDFRDNRSVGFRTVILLREFIRTEIQIARSETANELAEAVSIYTDYLNPIEGERMHNRAITYLREFPANKSAKRRIDLPAEGEAQKHTPTAISWNTCDTCLPLLESSGEQASGTGRTRWPGTL